ncbi:MAG TPA: DegT/DnrJ/EryC1/StrS family aminotransferase [Planctomycetota bacterium]|nr:DegT/DnrJ/EryC1/StrS family aminotransferase [Planctomycetota bacterium]
MRIDKLARDPERLRRRFIEFPSCRSAFGGLLAALEWGPDDLVILPAFVGVSTREGSGVLDPVNARSARTSFYRVRRDLTVDGASLEQNCQAPGRKLVLLIHFFGYVDPDYESLVRMARKAGAIVVEDEAHALLSDLVGGSCGRAGDAVLLSLHKLLPVSSGGALVLPASSGFLGRFPEALPLSSSPLMTLFETDLHATAEARRRHDAALRRLLAPHSAFVTPLWGSPGDGIVPQTLPVLVHAGRSVRDRLYGELNEQGFGVVTLYHTLVGAIGATEFADSHWLSDRILNLPVHQDVNVGEYHALVESLVAAARSR